MQLFDYDDRDKESILAYAKHLEGMTFQDVLNEYETSPVKHYVNLYENNINTDSLSETDIIVTNHKAKGQLGNLLERYYFGYEPNSNQEADFPKAGVELKQTPIDKKADGSFRAGERLSITNISYEEPVEDDFYKSHVWEKIQLILLIHYLRDKSVERLDYIIKFVNLFSPSKEDIHIIIEDYKTIVTKVKSGKAHELSESDTYYLGACTKGSTAEKSLRPQYYGDHTMAKKRNFCFKQSYMDFVLHAYVLPNKVPCEPIIQKDINLSFETHILGLINSHIGQTDKKLCDIYCREYNNNKAQWTDLVYRMLGIKGNHAEEFIKANVATKVIRIQKNGKNKESMSFPPVVFKQLVKQTWETSDIYEYFETTRILFVVFRQTESSCYELMGAQMWNMPYQDFSTLQTEWESIVSVIKEGVRFEVTKNGVKNNIPGIHDHKILHMRPHANKAAYSLKNGYTIGNVKRDADELPSGEWMTKQSFWLNSSYVLSQLKYK